MKMQRHLLCVAPLAVCALLLLSACGGPTPIAGRVTETAMPTVRPDTPASPTIGVPSTKPPESTGSPTADVSPSPAATATDAPLTPPPDTPTPTETPTETPTVTPTPEALTADTPAPDDAKPARPTETPAVLNIKPPEISGYLLKQGPDGGWVYKDKTGKEVAHTVTYSWEGLNWKKTVQRGALVVSDEKLMAYLLKTASEGRAKSEIPLFPLPFDPEGLELSEQKYSGFTVIAVTGRIQEVVQPLPGNRLVLFNNYGDSSGIWILLLIMCLLVSLFSPVLLIVHYGLFTILKSLLAQS